MMDPAKLTDEELIREGVKTWPVEDYAAKLAHELASRLLAAREREQAGRTSLAQEIRGVLAARGLWAGNGEVSDLITAVAKAIDDLRERERLDVETLKERWSRET